MAEGRDFSDVLFPRRRTPAEWRGRLDLETLEQQEGLPAGLLTAVLTRESAGDPRARSRAGAEGLFQFLPATAQGYSIDAYDPQQAAPAAARELGALYKKYQQDLPSTLAAWNWGQGNLDKGGLQQAPQETRGFIQAVTSLLSPRSAEAAAGPQQPPGRDFSRELFGDTPSRPAAPRAAPETPPGTEPARLEAAQGQRLLGPPGGRPTTPDESRFAPVVTPAQPDAPAGFDVKRYLPRVGMHPLIALPMKLGELVWPERAAEFEAARQQAEEGILPGLLAAGVGGLAGAAGGALAARVLPSAMQTIGQLAGTMAGSYGGRQANVALGLEEPGLGGDILSTAAPLTAYAPAVGRRLLASTRAGRAVGAAQQATGQQADEALAAYNQRLATAQARDIQAQEAYTQRGEAAYTAARQKMEGARYEAAQKVQAAQQAADEATRAAQLAYQQESQDAYQAAVTKARTLQQAYKEAVADYETAVQGQAGAAARLQQLPARYLPEVPARNLTDVRRDMALIEQGGPAAHTVMERLGVSTPQDASFRLAEEGNTLMQAGQPLPGRVAPPQPPSYAVPQPREGSPGIELQRFIRQQGGIRVEGEELAGELRGVSSRRETGTTGLLNNRSGRTLQQMAEAAAEQGYIPTADKTALLEAMRKSVGGTPVFEQSALLNVREPVTRPLPQPQPGRHTGRASQVLYERLEEVAGSAPVEMTPAIEAASVMQAQLGQALPSLQPTRLQRLLKDMTEQGTQGTVAQVHQALKDLGPLTRSNDGQTRGMAKHLVAGLQQALEQSAAEFPETGGARQLLQQANRAWRQEQGVADLQQLFTMGGPIVSQTPAGQARINVQALLNRFEKLVATDPFFAGSFPPAQLQALRQDLRSFIGTPTIPRQRPAPPGNVLVKDLGLPPAPVAPRPVLPPDAAPLPGLVRPQDIGPRPPPTPVEPFVPPAPVAPQLSPRTGMQTIRDVAMLSPAAMGYGGLPGKLAAGVAAADLGEYALSRILLTPRLRPLLLRALGPRGELDPRILAELAALAQVPLLTDEESP